MIPPVGLRTSPVTPRRTGRVSRGGRSLSPLCTYTLSYARIVPDFFILIQWLDADLLARQ
jgi:hypothetical protein